MKIVKNAHAGTLESSDAFVQVLHSTQKGITIELDSSVEEIYGDDIREVVKTSIEKMGLEDIHVKIQDKGAFDYIIEARLQTAVLRACEKDVPDWSVL